MISDKGSFAWNLDKQLELMALNKRIEQLEDYIKKKGLRLPRQKKPTYRGGYNTDSEE